MPRSTGGGGNPPPFFVGEAKSVPRRLSIFIDESGDFGTYQTHSPFYLVTLLFHDQDASMAHEISILDANISNIGFPLHALHTGPLIRREGYYRERTKQERKKLLFALLNYCKHVDIQYVTLCLEKKECVDIIDMTTRLTKLVSRYITAHLPFFHAFDETIIYYDNGQIELTHIITSTLTTLLNNISLRKVKPSDYKLFQLADMFCTLELVAMKFDRKSTSHSEIVFFHSKRDFKRNYLKEIRKKLLA
jgi:hypothetical protein